MSIDASAIYSAPASSTGSTTSAAKNTLDSQAFLNLLVAQLANQDPSSPMDTNDLMAQTTQLATMEQLTELTSTSREGFALQMRMAAASLVGQQVTYTDADGVTQTGVVSSVSYTTAVPTVMVGDKEVTLDAVATVTAAGATPTPPTTPAPSA